MATIQQCLQDINTRFYRISAIIVAVITLQLCNPQPVGASFILRSGSQSGQKSNLTENIFHTRSLQVSLIRHMLFRKPFDLRHGPRYRSHLNDNGSPTFPIISSVSSFVGLICIAMLLASFSPIILGIGIASAVCGIVFGAMGLRKQMKGLAIAGMVLGILEILAGIAAVIIAAVAVVTLSSC